MKTTTTTSGLKVKANVKAGGLWTNHSRVGLVVKTGLKAGDIIVPNHNRRLAVH